MTGTLEGQSFGYIEEVELSRQRLRFIGDDITLDLRIDPENFGYYAQVLLDSYPDIGDDEAAPAALKHVLMTRPLQWEWLEWDGTFKFE